jgi:hypothetical protein
MNDLDHRELTEIELERSDWRPRCDCRQRIQHRYIGDAQGWPRFICQWPRIQRIAGILMQACCTGTHLKG